MADTETKFLMWWVILADLVVASFILRRSPAYSMRAPKTKRTHTMTQASMAVRPSA